MSSETFWLAVGFPGQALFSVRCLVQGMIREIWRERDVPRIFRRFSSGAGATRRACAVRRQDPAFITGQTLGLIVCIRNPMPIRARAGTETRP